MTEIRIEFTRFSAFYTPLIATMAGGFLDDEGLEPVHSISAPGKSAIEKLADGSVDVVQSAPSQAFRFVEQGRPPPAVHFAQINEKDGFFLTGRRPEDAFDWAGLAGRRVLVDHGGHPIFTCRLQELRTRSRPGRSRRRASRSRSRRGPATDRPRSRD